LRLFTIAIYVYRDALAILKEIGNPLGQAAALNNIGLVYFQQGRLEEALKSYQDALTIHKEISKPLGQANTLLNIGRVYFNQDKKTEAMELFGEARAIFLEIGATRKWQLVERRISQLETAMK